MLLRQIINFAPSLIVPALVSMLATVLYTRLMTPSEFGFYALAMTSMNLLNAAFFVWLQVATSRLVAEANRLEVVGKFRAASYTVFGISALILVLCTMVLCAVAPTGAFRTVAPVCVSLTLARALLSMNQVFHRSTFRVLRYNLLEGGQAALGLAIGLILVHFGRFGGAGAVAGITIGLVLILLADFSSLLNLPFRSVDRQSLYGLLRFGLPLIGALALFTLIPALGQFIIVHDLGVAELGGYMAGYTLVDRIMSMVFMIVVTPSYPLLVNRLEREGPEGARDQTFRTGTVMLGVGLPACVGLVLASGHMVEFFIGPEFRDVARQVMPWIAVAATINGLTSQYCDHAFHLGKKTYLLAFTQGPVVLFSLAANLVLVPRFGYMGAVYGTLSAYFVLMILSVTVGRFAFPMKFPFLPALQIGACTATMGIVVGILKFKLNTTGFVEMIMVGFVVYFAMFLVLDIMNIRRLSRNFLDAKILGRTGHF